MARVRVDAIITCAAVEAGTRDAHIIIDFTMLSAESGVASLKVNKSMDLLIYQVIN